MGIANPRPAQRARETRIVHAKLAWHSTRSNELEAQGMSRPDASRQAFVEIAALHTEFLKEDDRKLAEKRKLRKSMEAM